MYASTSNKSNENMSVDKFCAIDVEKMNPSHLSICSIGVCLFENGKLIKKFYSKVCPVDGRENSFALRVHGMTYDSVKDCPTFDNLWKNDILPMLNGCTAIVAHNVSVEFNAITNTLDFYGIESPEIDWVDTLSIGRRKLVGMRSYALDKVAVALDVVCEHHHNALDDALVCGEIFNRLNEIETFKDMRGIEIISNDDFKFDMNKNRSVKLDDSFPLSGKSVCVSGVYEHWGNREFLKELLWEHGCKIVSSVCGKTDCLVCGNGAGPAKIRKATENGILIVDENRVVEMLRAIGLTIK